MEDLASFGSREYLLLFAVLFCARGADFLSTWLATPNLVLEGNPIAKKLGWRWGIPVNLLLCAGFAFWMLPAVVISTTSALVAARNFQGAWLMRSMGEENYRRWHVERLLETPTKLFLACLFAHTGLMAAVGCAVIYFSGGSGLVVMGVGLGIIGYAAVVLFYSLLGVWRMRRNTKAIARLESRPWRDRTGNAPGIHQGFAPDDVRASGS